MNRNLLATFSLFILGLLILANLLSQSFRTVAVTTKGPSEQARSEVEELCGRLSEIKKVPFKGEPVNDEVYNKIISQGDAAIPCLIDKITDMTAMPDPRSAPIYPDFRVGDLAFILLVRITSTPFEQMLPSSVRVRMKDEGVYAYFKYVERPSNRSALQKRWKAWLKER